MDIICPVCSEPWDVDELHYTDGLTFDQARRIFFSKGCGAVFGGSCKPNPTAQSSISAALADMLGDDIDGIAAMTEDAEFMGLFD
jgi:hypothetical protein